MQSQQIKVINNSIEAAMHEIDLIEILKEEKVQQIDIIDSSAQLMGISKKIKLINQAFQRILTSNDEFPEIKIGTPLDIEITKQVNSLCYRFHCQNLFSPLQFKVSFLNQKAN